MQKKYYFAHNFKEVSLTNNVKTTRRKSSESINQNLCLEKAYTAKQIITNPKRQDF